MLVEHHRAFLRVLERRVGSRAVAEELLQNAFVKTLGRLDAVPACGTCADRGCLDCSCGRPAQRPVPADTAQKR